MSQYISKQQYPISNMVVGDDWYELIPVVQADGVIPWDFSGWSAKAQVRDPLTGEVVIEFDSTLSVPTIEFNIDSGTEGMYLIADKTDTSLLIPGKYIWDCQFTDDLGLERTLIIESLFEIINQQTQ